VYLVRLVVMYVKLFLLRGVVYIVMSLFQEEEEVLIPKAATGHDPEPDPSTPILTTFLTKIHLTNWHCGSSTTRLTTADSKSRHWTRSRSPQPVFRTFILMLFSHLLLGLSSGRSSRGFPTKILFEFVFSSIVATFAAHRNLLWINQLLICEQNWKLSLTS
jgi:hypothetical protein